MTLQDTNLMNEKLFLDQSIRDHVTTQINKRMTSIKLNGNKYLRPITDLEINDLVLYYPLSQSNLDLKVYKYTGVVMDKLK